MAKSCGLPSLNIARKCHTLAAKLKSIKSVLYYAYHMSRQPSFEQSDVQSDRQNFRQLRSTLSRSTVTVRAKISGSETANCMGVAVCGH